MKPVDVRSIRSDGRMLFRMKQTSSLINIIQGSRDLHLKWREACMFARRIDEALKNGEILVDKKKR